jgi:2-C-methyl-D-erythritol 4-phosphate cytidylyltransferase
VQTSAILVAAGRGTRIGAATGKAFLSLAGQPLVLYPLRTLSQLPRLHSIALVIPSGQEERAAELLGAHGPWPVPIHLTPGGTERQDSVAAGLGRIEPETDLVLIHDAARPFVSLACLDACLEAAAATGAAIAAVPARDTVKLADEAGSVAQTLDRRKIWLAQTPQAFRTALLRRAYEQARQDGYVATDDAALVERLGVPVRIVPGDEANRKITTPHDLQWAEWYLLGRTSERR